MSCPICGWPGRGTGGFLVNDFTRNFYFNVFLNADTEAEARALWRDFHEEHAAEVVHPSSAPVEKTRRPRGILPAEGRHGGNCSCSDCDDLDPGRPFPEERY